MVSIILDSVLFSVKTDFAEKILSGEKTLEFRKRPPRCRLPYIMYLYGTTATIKTEHGIITPGAGAVLGYAIVTGQISTNIFSNTTEKYFFSKSMENAESNTETIYIDADEAYHYQKYILEKGCVSRSELERYTGTEKIYGLVISEYKRFAKPVPLSAFGINRAPQSWKYLKEDSIRKIKTILAIHQH